MWPPGMWLEVEQEAPLARDGKASGGEALPLGGVSSVG